MDSASIKADMRNFFMTISWAKLPLNHVGENRRVILLGKEEKSVFW